MDNPIKKSVNDSDMKEEEPPGAALNGNVSTKMWMIGHGSKSGGIDNAAITISEARLAQLEEKRKSKNGGPELNKAPMNERRRFLVQVRMILRLEFRDRFGVRFSNRCGHWLDRYMTHLVWKYVDWLDYPDGNHILKGHTSEVKAAAISSDGRFLFTAQFGGSIIVWDLLDYSMLKLIDAFARVIYCLIYERDLLVSAANDNKIRIFNGITHDLICTLQGHSSYACTLRLNKKGNQLLSASVDKTVKIWCVKTGNCLATLTGHTWIVVSTYFMDNDTKIITGSLDNSIKVWNVDDKCECDTFINAEADQTYDMCVNCDSSLVTCCSGPNGIIVYNWPKMDIVRSMQVQVQRGQFHPSNPDILAVLFANSFTAESDPDAFSIRIYNVRSGDRIAEFEGHSSIINGLCWSRDGSILVSVSLDQSVRVWDCAVLLE